MFMIPTFLKFFTHTHTHSTPLTNMLTNLLHIYCSACLALVSIITNAILYCQSSLGGGDWNVAYAGTTDDVAPNTPLLFGSYPPNEEGAEGYRDDDDDAK